MKFITTKLSGAIFIELEPIFDERGFFARNYCVKEFAEKKLKMSIVQCNISRNNKKGTLRGMHFQTASPEMKLVSCMKGSIYDVIIDLRPDSSTYCQWIARELSEDNFRQIFIPEGFAHGFQTLTDDSIVFYQMSEFYNPAGASGVRWNDQIFKINWPLGNPIISERDNSFSDYRK